jgi:uncharacterized protein
VNGVFAAALATVSGLVFGLGLIAGGMTDPAKVKGFLDLFGAWDPSLAFVMAGAISVGALAFALARRRRRSWSGAPIDIPSNTVIDRRLLAGGVVFGVGWGIAGFCPGPAIVAAGAGTTAALGFVAAMLIGMFVHDRWLIRL